MTSSVYTWQQIPHAYAEFQILEMGTAQMAECPESRKHVAQSPKAAVSIKSQVSVSFSHLQNFGFSAFRKL